MNLMKVIGIWETFFHLGKVAPSPFKNTLESRKNLKP